MGRLAFVMTGPQGGQVVNLDEDDFAQALKDGWAIDFEKANLGGDPDPFRGHNTEPHAKAEAWLAKRGLYPTREMRPEEPKEERSKAKPKDEPKEESKPAGDDKPKASPAKK